MAKIVLNQFFFSTTLDDTSKQVRSYLNAINKEVSTVPLPRESSFRFLFPLQAINPKPGEMRRPEKGKPRRLRGAIDAETTGGDRPTKKQKTSDNLHDAVERGDVDAVRNLIEGGADVNKARDDGVTPLYWAALQGHEAVVKALIEAGADVNKADNR